MKNHNYENLQSFVGKLEGIVRFQTVNQSEIDEAEQQLGFSFPEGLKKFYHEVGYGWIGDEKKPHIRNLVIHPLDIVDLFLGISEFQPPEGFLEGDLPVFDCGGDKFLIVRPSTKNPEKVYRDDGEDHCVANNFHEFIYKLIIAPSFYEEY